MGACVPSPRQWLGCCTGDHLAAVPGHPCAAVADTAPPLEQRLPRHARGATGLAPKADRQKAREGTTPADAATPVDRPPLPRSRSRSCAWRTTIPGGGIAGSTANCPGRDTRSHPQPCGRSCTLPASARPRVAPVRAGASSSTVYLREDVVCRALDQWIARAFAPVQALSLASTTASTAQTRTPEQTQARQAIKDCERRLARYQVALDAGADPAVATQWINDAQGDREEGRVCCRVG